MVKGYEFTKGQYVIFTPEELKALDEKSTNTVEITEFVPADQVDRKVVKKSYFLGPDKGGDRAYRLLAEALRQTGRVAVGQYAAPESFQPDKYEDNVRKRVLEQIQRKVEGKEITEEPTEAPKTQIIDLMEALRASLKAKGTAGERKPTKRVEGKASKAAPAAKRRVGGARG